MTPNRTAVAFGVFAIWGLTALACYGYAQAEIMTSSVELRNAIQSELPAGSSKNAIEQFFEKRKIPFMWDKYTGIGFGIIRNIQPFHSIRVEAFLDDSGRLLRAEVYDSYTAP
jgi:hypothetical protein